RRFAGTVHTQDPGTLPGSNTPLDVPQYGLLAVVNIDVDQVYDVFSEAGDRQLHQLGAIAHRRLLCDQRICGLDAEFGFGSARRRATTEPDKLLAHEVLAFGFGRRGTFVAFDSLQHIRGIAAAESLDGSVVHLPCEVADRI